MPTAAAIDFESLTLGEIARIESLSGLPIDQAFNDGQPRGKALAALVLITARRTGRPDFTWDDALATSQKDAMAMLGMDGAPQAEPSDVPGDDALGE